MDKIFLSHSSKNKDYVRPIFEYFGGDRCIFDEMTFETGMQTLKEIFKGIDNADIFVFFISNDSLESPWVKKEIFQAILKDKVKKIKNYSGGCPFDYRLKATLHGGEIVDIYYASDSCGVLVFGDSTYEVELAEEEEFKYRDQLTDFFSKP